MPLEAVRLSGLVTPEDVPADVSDPGAWTEASGVNFREGIAERVAGWREIYDTTNEPPLHVINNYFDGSNYWLYASDDEINVTDEGGTHKDITPAAAPSTGADSNIWTSCELNGLPVLNFGEDYPVYWGRDYGTPTVCATLPDWPANYTAKVMRAFKYYLVAMNIYGGGTTLPATVKWSDAAAQGIPDDGAGTTWSATAENDSGELDLGATAEGINDGLALRDEMLICKAHSTYKLIYVGGVAVFGQRQFSATAGALAANCMAEYRGQMVTLADGDVWITDGQQMRSLVDRRVRRNLFSRLDVDNFTRSYVVAHPLKHEVWICIPETGATYPNLALVWNAETDKLSYRDINGGGSGIPHMAPGNISESGLAKTWTTITGTWATNTNKWSDFNAAEPVNGLVGVEFDAPNLVLMDTGLTQDTGTINSRLRREGLDFGDREAVKLVTEFWPRITGPAGIQVNIRLGTQDAPEDAISWGASSVYTLGTDKFINTRTRGRLISVEIQSTDISGQWRCTGGDFKLMVAGRYHGK